MSLFKDKRLDLIPKQLIELQSNIFKDLKNSENRILSELDFIKANYCAVLDKINSKLDALKPIKKHKKHKRKYTKKIKVSNGTGNETNRSN